MDGAEADGHERAVAARESGQGAVRCVLVDVEEVADDREGGAFVRRRVAVARETGAPWPEVMRRRGRRVPYGSLARRAEQGRTQFIKRPVLFVTLTPTHEYSSYSIINHHIHRR